MREDEEGCFKEALNLSEGILDLLKACFKGFLSFLKGNFQGFLSCLKGLLKACFKGFLSFLKGLFKGSLSFFKPFKALFQGVPILFERPF